MRAIVVAVFALIWTFGSIHAITLDGYLTLAKQHHPLFKREQKRIDLAKAKQAEQLGSKDIMLSLAPSYLAQNPIQKSPFQPRELKVSQIEGGMSTSFWSTGGRLSISGLTQKSDERYSAAASFGIPEGSFYTNSLSLTYVQPILRNAGGVLDRLMYELEGINVDITTLKVRETEESFLLDIGNRFLDWILLNEQRRILKNRLYIAKDQLQTTESKRDLNLVTTLDVLRAQDAVSIVDSNLMLIEGQWKAKKQELTTLVGVNDFIKSGYPGYNIYETRIDISISDLEEKLSTESRFLTQIDAQLSFLEKQKLGALEQLKHNLYLTASVTVEDWDRNLGSAVDFDKNAGLVGATWEFPVSNTKAKAMLAQVDTQIEQVKLQRKVVLRELLSAAKNVAIQLNELKKVLELNQDQIKTAEAKTKEEVTLYNQGRSQLTFVIQARDNEQNAQLTYSQNAITYMRLRLQFLALTDQLLELG